MSKGPPKACPKVVYLQRHAPAAAFSPSGDRGRVLTPEGRESFKALIADLRDQLAPRAVVTSPYARARETAQLLAEPFGLSPSDEPRLASGAGSGADLLRLAASSPAGTALVGHNPEVSEALCALTGTGAAVPPGAIAALEVAPHAVRVLWLQVPKGLSRGG